MIGEWTPCGEPGCIMNAGHPGPHYTTSMSSGSAPVMDYKDAEIAALKARLAAVEAERDRLRAQVGHAGWVGGMVLGICEEAPGWEDVKEYPAGPEVEAWGAPSIVAAKALMRRALAAEARLDAAEGERDAWKAQAGMRRSSDEERVRALEAALARCRVVLAAVAVRESKCVYCGAEVGLGAPHRSDPPYVCALRACLEGT